MSEQQQYRVHWSVDVYASNPREAAQSAADDFFQPHIAQGEVGSACVFEVALAPGDHLDAEGTSVRVALDEKRPWDLAIRLREGIPLTPAETRAVAEHLDALSKIHAEMDGELWNSDTTHSIAAHLAHVGLDPAAYAPGEE